MNSKSKSHSSWLQRAFVFLCGVLPLLVVSSPARAGIWEIGASGSYRRQNIDVDAVDESQSITGSLSYYLDQASAIELSYTDGISKRSINPTVVNGHITTATYKALGLDFVYTLGSGSTRPYIKAGAQYLLEKRIVDQYLDNSGNFQPKTSESSPSLVPSVGVGFKMGLTTTISLKAGVDAWTSESLSVRPVKIDYAGRCGLSWMF